jgi:predicted XRE-type DNA-binding protein
MERMLKKTLDTSIHLRSGGGPLQPYRVRRHVPGWGFCASRLPQEDTANGETGSAFGGVSAAGTHGEDASVWDALEDASTEVANMRLRSSLMIAITEAVAAWRVNQTEAARGLRVTQPRLNDLRRGRIDKFSLDALVELAARAGLAVHLEIKSAA